MLFGGGYVNDVLVRDTLTTARVMKNKFDSIVFCCGWVGRGEERLIVPRSEINKYIRWLINKAL